MELIRERLSSCTDAIADEIVDDVRRRIQALMRKEEGIVGQPEIEIMRVLSQLYAHVPPSGPIREALEALATNWTEHEEKRTTADSGTEILIALLVHADEVERAIDEFVVGDRTPASPRS